MTIILGLLASPIGPGPLKGELDPLMPILGWLMFGVFFLIGWMAFRLSLFAVRRVESPAAAFAQDFRILGPRLPILGVGIALASLDLYFFMWLKPQLTALHPFWADTALANVGHFLFGKDPWRYLTFMLNEWVGMMYTPIWFTTVIASMYWLLLQAPKERRARLLVTYFLLWSVLGPIGQTFFSSAGPIFYHRIYGLPRYDELTARLPKVTRLSSDYLWDAYKRGQLAYGAGISAMPSLHVGTVTWGVLVFHREQRWLRIMSWGFAIFIAFASVALGWHYSLDGFVAIAGALGCYWLAGQWVRLWQSIAAQSAEPTGGSRVGRFWRRRQT